MNVKPSNLSTSDPFFIETYGPFRIVRAENLKVGACRIKNCTHWKLRFKDGDRQWRFVAIRGYPTNFVQCFNAKDGFRYEVARIYDWRTGNFTYDWKITKTRRVGPK